MNLISIFLLSEPDLFSNQHSNNKTMIKAPQHPESLFYYLSVPPSPASSTILHRQTPQTGDIDLHNIYFIYNIIFCWTLTISKTIICSLIMMFIILTLTWIVGENMYKNIPFIERRNADNMMRWQYDNIHNNGVKTLQMFWQRSSSVKYLSSVVHNDSCLPMGQNLTL